MNEMYLTSNENVLIWCSDELHCFGREECHVLVHWSARLETKKSAEGYSHFINRCRRDVFIGGIEEGDEYV